MTPKLYDLHLLQNVVNVIRFHNSYLIIIIFSITISFKINITKNIMHPENQENIQPTSNILCQPTRPKYGNMIVLYSGSFLITLGPDYLFFIPTFLSFVAVSIAMTIFIIHSTSSIFFWIASFIINGTTCISYILVAISDPGIVTSEKAPSIEDQQALIQRKVKSPYKRKCQKCLFMVKPRTFHCKRCNVCVEDHDHHCPWTSKCIGKNNLTRFNVFLTMVPTFLIFTFISFAAAMMKDLGQPKAHL